ncbi:MAG: P-II family nitrogen regulator [Sedimentisphaerales bacterium]|nr:P-II family nitrogen regulator [Sedimentisphaerales bacterium]
MKELKAYIRPTFLNSIIEELEKAGAKDLTVIRVDALGALADSEFDRWHIVRKYDEKYYCVAKLELVCADEDADRFMEIIREHGHTGEKGDGRVFVSWIEEAVNIRTGQRGEEAL